MAEILRQLFGTEGGWILAALSVAGVIGTFVGYGWEGAAIVAILVLVLIALALARVAVGFKRQLDAGHGGDRDVAVEEGFPQDEAPAVTPSLTEGDVQADEDEEEEQVQQPAESEEGPLAQAFASVDDGDFRTARLSFAEWVASAEGAEGELNRSVVAEQMLMRAGDDTALERLRTIADSHPEAPGPAQALGEILSGQGLFRDAALEVRRRASQLPPGSNLSALHLIEATAYFELAEFDASEQLCRQVVDHGASEQVARAHHGLARIAEVRGDALARLHHLARAVAVQPNENQRRFDLAYAASPLGFNDLAVFQYRQIERSDRSFSMALNNLGAILAGHQALGLSRDYMRRSMEQGNALSAGNLANAAAVAGFLEEAEVFIRRSEQFKDTSPRVGEAQQRIEKERESNQEALTQLEDAGKVSLDALLGAYQSDIIESPQGVWTVGDVAHIFEPHGAGSTSKTDHEQYRFATEMDVLKVFYSFSPLWQEVEGLAVWTGDDHIRLLLPPEQANGISRITDMYRLPEEVKSGGEPPKGENPR